MVGSSHAFFSASPVFTCDDKTTRSTRSHPLFPLPTKLPASNDLSSVSPPAKAQRIMAMRDMVTGGAACAVPGSSSTSNPIGALANVLIGTSSKTQERLNEIPTTTSTGSSSQFNLGSDGRLTSLPGSELDYQQNQNLNNQGAAFLDRFHASNQGGLADAWNEIQNPLAQHHPYGQTNFPAPHQMFDQTQLPLDGPPRQVLSNFLHSFVNSTRGGMPFRPSSLPTLGLTQGDKQCIRDRSSIMARHFFADKSEDFIHAQVDALLSSLDIDSDAQMRMPLPGRFREMDDYWNESQRVLAPVPPSADGWITEFGQQRVQHAGPDDWVNSFEQQHGPNGWASEFDRDQALMTSANQVPGAHISNIAMMEQSRMLAHTLAQNNDPKFQNSRFHQFVSKMSRGELFVEDNQFKTNTASASGDWAAEYQEQYNVGHLGVEERLVVGGADKWASEFASTSAQHIAPDDQWVDEFSKLHVEDWAEEFGNQIGKGAIGEDSTDSWVNAYDEYMNEQIAMKQQSNGEYVYSEMNPYVGHPDPLKEGQELFRKGLLSEAVLALEAEIMKNPGNAEGWRLLGIAHAENDDDQQAIAAMLKAQEADPTNLEVLLALGVSHTNELEQAAALKYLFQWLRHHPKYGSLAPPETPASLYHADVSRMFNEAAQMSPEDTDIHIVLGVLYNLSREYDKAIESFNAALKLKPQDYSLWNKLGATQANSIQSADAILAYQQALDLKPNYVRAWANMGISYANQGMYEESIRFYVRALAMNPKADNAWQYLRISLSSASRNDMLEACDARNLDVLQKEFPIPLEAAYV
ncbi:hypothetical protein V2J09_007621 [Rumex salicifolius]